MLTNPALNSALGKFGSVKEGLPVLNRYIQIFISLAFGLSGLILLIMLIWGGYQYMTSGGDKESTEKAHKRITQALIGIIILFSVFAIISIIEILFGIKILNPILPVI